MPYDPLTLWLLIVFVTVLTSGILVLTWMTTPGSDVLGYWAAAFLLTAVSIAGVAARGHIPNFASIEIANAVAFLGGGLMWLGFRRFDHRPLKVPVVLIAPALWIAACQIELFRASTSNRVVLASIMIVAILLACVRELRLGSTERIVSRTVAIVVLSVQALVVASRILVVQTMDLDRASGFILRTDPVFAWYGLGALVFMVLMAFTMVALVRERRELVYKRASMMDELTGLLNRRGFMGSAMRACLPDRPFAVLALDLDRFKEVNDRHGHAAGDDLLATFAQVLRAQVRGSDIVARLGGEEFGVLMPDVGLDAACQVAERIRAAFRAEAGALRLSGVAGTVSIGVAVGIAPASIVPESIGPLLARADAALYRAKAQGRDRVETSRAEAQPALRAVV